MFTWWKNPRLTARHLLRQRADAARDARDWRAAAVLYDVYLASDPGAREAEVWIQLGHCRKEAGDLEGALPAYRRGLALAPDRADTHLQIGHLHKTAGRREDAAASYAAALRLDPRDGDARAELVALERHAGDGEAAATRVPASESLARADAARDAACWPEAAALYAEHLAAHPDAADAQATWVQLGHARKEAGDRDGAVLAYEAALGLDPADAETHVHLGHLHKAMGAVEAAVGALSEALRLAPDSPQVEQDLRDLAATVARRRMAAARGALRYAHPLPWSGDRSAFQGPFPPIHAALSRRFGSRDADAP